MISTPDLCDQFGDRVQVAEPVFRHYGGQRQFAGPCQTIQCYEDNSRVAEQVAEAGRGRVLMVDGGASLRRSLLGDNLAGKAVANGWSGIVIYGCLRDVEAIAAMDLGVMALASIPRKTEKLGQGKVGVPLSFAGLRLQPGYWVYADETGLIAASTRLV